MRPLRLVAFIALLSLAGCAMLFREEAPLQHYTLGTPAGQEVETAAAEMPEWSIGLRRVGLAGHLETRAIVLRSREHRLQFSDHHRWAGELRREISRALAGHLVARAPSVRVDTAPWPSYAEHDYLLQIQVSRFEGITYETGDQNGEAHLLADWEILNARDREVVARGTTNYRESGWTVNDHVALVRMLNEGLRVLSEDVINQLGTIADD